jgi:hypothetical protein
MFGRTNRRCYRFWRCDGYCRCRNGPKTADALFARPALDEVLALKSGKQQAPYLNHAGPAQIGIHSLVCRLAWVRLNASEGGP